MRVFSVRNLVPPHRGLVIVVSSWSSLTLCPAQYLIPFKGKTWTNMIIFSFELDLCLPPLFLGVETNQIKPNIIVFKFEKICNIWIPIRITINICIWFEPNFQYSKNICKFLVKAMQMCYLQKYSWIFVFDSLLDSYSIHLLVFDLDESLLILSHWIPEIKVQDTNESLN